MFNKEIYRKRRESLKRELGSGLVVMPGNNDSPMNYPANAYHFRQDSSFLYFFGIDKPGFTGIIDIEENKDYLIGNDATLDDIIWMGKGPALQTLGELSGVDSTMLPEKIEEIINRGRSGGQKIHYLPPYRADKLLLFEKWLGVPASRVTENASVELIKAVIKLRSVKSPGEILEIEKALEIAFEMHMAVMRMAKPGVFEREIAGHIEGISLSHGSPVSYPVILTRNGEILHNHFHGNNLREGDLLLTDAGSESALHYASDITRTIPVSGKFSSIQKDIYEIVLQALDDSIKLIKPGVPFRDIHINAARVIVSNLKLLDIMKGDVDEAVEQGAHALFFPHGLGHMLGLDVHDMEDLNENFVGYDNNIKRSEKFGLAFLRFGRRLLEGHVLTVEPGIYFIPALIEKWKSDKKFTKFINYSVVEKHLNFGGIRIEDNIMVTGDGSRILGRPIPKTVADIEQACTK